MSTIPVSAVQVSPVGRRPIVVASNMLVDEESRVLMGIRKDSGLWEYPGGKVEEESLVEAARREHLEETAMKLIGDPRQIGVSDGWKWSGQYGKPWYICVGFLWRKWKGFPRLVEGKHTRWEWWSLSSLPPEKYCSWGTRELTPLLLKTLNLNTW